MINRYLLEVVREAYLSPFTVSSNFARANAAAVAMASGEDYITTKIVGDTYCSVWRVTVEGLRFLKAMDELDKIDGESE
jgi:hypothetical protein